MRGIGGKHSPGWLGSYAYFQVSLIMEKHGCPGRHHRTELCAFSLRSEVRWCLIFSKYSLSEVYCASRPYTTTATYAQTLPITVNKGQ